MHIKIYCIQLNYFQRNSRIKEKSSFFTLILQNQKGKATKFYSSSLYMPNKRQNRSTECGPSQQFSGDQNILGAFKDTCLLVCCWNFLCAFGSISSKFPFYILNMDLSTYGASYAHKHDQYNVCSQGSKDFISCSLEKSHTIIILVITIYKGQQCFLHEL